MSDRLSDTPRTDAWWKTVTTCAQDSGQTLTYLHQAHAAMEIFERELAAVQLLRAAAERTLANRSELANVGAAVAWSLKTVVLIDGRPHRPCDCPQRTGDCAKGFERRLLTAELSRCLVPVDAPTPAAPPNKGVTTEERMKHYPVEFGSPKRLECSCGNPDPAHPVDAATGERGEGPG